MTTTVKKTEIKAGDQIHILVTGVTIPVADFTPSIVALRGDTVTVTEAMIEASRDRHGRSWLDAVVNGDDPRVGLGPFPSNEPVLLPDTREFEAERARRREQAWLIPTEAERELALAQVLREFGAPRPSGSFVAYDSRA